MGWITKRRVGWFVGSAVLVLMAAELALPGGVAGMVIGPSLLRERIGPLDAKDQALGDVLMQICRQLDDKDRHTHFNLSPDDLALTVSVNYPGGTRFKQVLKTIEDTTNRKCRYGTCGTCGGIMGGISLQPRDTDTSAAFRYSADVDCRRIQMRTETGLVTSDAVSHLNE